MLYTKVKILSSNVALLRVARTGDTRFSTVMFLLLNFVGLESIDNWEMTDPNKIISFVRAVERGV